MTELAWDMNNCKCGGVAVMGIMSLVARCDKCPRVYAQVRSDGRGEWFANIAEANAAYRAAQRIEAQSE